MAIRILLALVVMSSVASAQTAPAKITIGVYAPSVEFGSGAARLTYAQGLAKAIEQNTGIKTQADAYATLGALKKANPDYAIIDGLCYATNLSWKLLANATVDGGTTRLWALYTNAGNSMQALKGKKLAYIQAGCSDTAFIDNAMLESEVDASFFSARVNNNDLTGAVASVSSYKTAQAVFAPASAAKGLTKLFDTANVPNPAFVEVNSSLPATTTEKVAAAVLGYGGGGAIEKWARPSRDVYSALQGRLGPVRKQGVFAAIENARLSSTNILNDPASIKEPQYVAPRRDFLRGPARMGE